MKEEITKNFYNSLNNLIYDYLCEKREDKTSLPDSNVIGIIRRATMDNLKFFMDTAFSIHGQNLFSIKSGFKDDDHST